MTIDVDRRQVLRYRVRAHGLDREAGAVADLAVLDLGVQDTNVGSARLALAARLPEPSSDPLHDPSLQLLWSFRGAPHVHRAADLRRLAGALWPVSDADAIARLAAERKPLTAAGIDGLTAFTTAAKAMRAVVTKQLSKGEVSAAVTERLPEAYAYACRSCKATHVYGGLFQLVGLFAGVRLVPDQSPATLAPLPKRPPVPTASRGLDEVVRAYLRLHGPAKLSDAAGYVGTKPTAIPDAWPGDLLEVRVDGRRAWIAEERAGALRDAAPVTDIVRLLPPSDPYLQARDRDLLVPERERQKAVWRILGNPGVVLAGTEVAGVWRARTAGKSRLDVTVQPFERLPARTRKAVEAEAARMAAVRDAADVRVAYDDA